MSEPRRGLAIASLLLGILSLPTLAGLLIGGAAGLVLGIVALVRASREPALYGGKGLAIAGIALSGLSFLVIPFIGIIAAIAIPSLLRARVSANEAAAIGDVRTVISAQMAYASANGGHYGTLECLGQPGPCVAGYSGPVFLDPVLASGVPKTGYERQLQPGPVSQSTGAAGERYTGIASFAYVARPLQPGRTGVRAFCGDASGTVFFRLDAASATAAATGECGEGWTALQ
jgi:type II secretory pathway pseudopilin PulG